MSTKLAKSNGNGKHAGGRPTKYKPEYVQQAYQLALLHATDSQIADFFGVSEQSLNNWKKPHPELFESLKEGKLFADAQVAHSLYQQAMKGNITACIFWLKNRQPALWRDKHEVNVKGAILNLTMDLGDGKPVELNAAPEAIEGVVEGEDGDV